MMRIDLGKDVIIGWAHGYQRRSYLSSGVDHLVVLTSRNTYEALCHKATRVHHEVGARSFHNRACKICLNRQKRFSSDKPVDG